MDSWNQEEAVVRMLEAEGVRFEMPDRCKCGAICTDAEAIAHLRQWDHLRKLCAFCGEPIRIVFMKLNHVHKSKIDEEGWGVTNTYRSEDHYDWSGHSPYGWFEVNAHISCAKKGMLYANFEHIEYDRPRVIPEGGMPKCWPMPCETCKALPTKEDIRKVAALVYSFMGPCVYCNQPIKLNTLQVQHRSLAGEHLGYWHFKEYWGEGTLKWWGHRPDNFERLEFNGHLLCAVKAMPHLRWSELDYVLDYWSKEIPFARNLEQISLAKKKLMPELANKNVRRHLFKVIAKCVQGTTRIKLEQLDFLVRKEIYDLKEGPREWVPGLKK